MSYYVVKLSPDAHASLKALRKKTGVTIAFMTRAAIDDYVTAEVRPYVPDAWVDYDKTKVGYEVPLTRHFYRYVPPRPLAEIDAELRLLEAEVQVLLAEVAK